MRFLFRHSLAASKQEVYNQPGQSSVAFFVALLFYQL